MKKLIDKKNNVTSTLKDKTSFLEIIEGNLCKESCKECLFEYCAIRG